MEKKEINLGERTMCVVDAYPRDCEYCKTKTKHELLFVDVKIDRKKSLMMGIALDALGGASNITGDGWQTACI
jgi:hypothetical protein